MRQDQIHPHEIDLARWDEPDGGRDGVAEHLRWCARCRSVAADHRWLRDEIAATLSLAADAVPVPRPRWWAVQETLLVNQRRQVRGWWTSAVASVVAAVCLMLAVSPMFGPALGAATVAPGTAPPVGSVSANVIATAPDTVVSTAPSATPTPVVLRERTQSLQEQEGTRSPTPVLLLPPTPEI